MLCVAGIDVGKHGCDSLPLQRVGRGDESVGRHNHLAREFQSADGDFQGDRGVAHGDDVSDAEALGQQALEFADERPIIGKQTPIEDVADQIEVALPIADIGLADMNWFGEGRARSVDGKIGWPVNLLLRMDFL